MTRQAKAQEAVPANAGGDAQYVLRLYVSGATPRSVEAIANLSEICESRLKGRYDLQVIDVYQQPELARGKDIVAVPTLIKQLPLPLRRLVGNLSREARVLIGLDLEPRPPADG